MILLAVNLPTSTSDFARVVDGDYRIVGVEILPGTASTSLVVAELEIDGRTPTVLLGPGSPFMAPIARLGMRRGTTGAAVTVSVVLYEAGDPLPVTGPRIGQGGSAPLVRLTDNDGDVAGIDASGSVLTRYQGPGRTVLPAAVADGTVLDAYLDSVGRPVVSPYAIGEQHVSGVVDQVALGAGGTATLLAAPGAGIRNNVGSLSGSASAATVLTLRDGAGGTVLWSFSLAVGGTFAYGLPVPLRQPTAATLLQLASSLAATVSVNATGFLSR